ncbi:uncharacterized protein LOC115995073 isoform X1 [Quercus lobata]|uniref:Uncharacterized protein n=1 Tax=Quercus lobata TaxID=97700 RepID=A0A7N2LZG5_QUELO|nr:uncharacterized protein LOC115995073 isoform X1 [Quercus lobata]
MSDFHPLPYSPATQPPSSSSSPPQQSSSSSSSIKPMMISPLYKQHSWSPDAYRDEAWLRRKGNHKSKNRNRSKSVTDEDVDELKGCIELGFGFELIDSPDHVVDQRLSDTLPALGLYYAVNKHYNDTVSNSKSTLTPSSSTASDSDTPSSPLGSPHHTLLGPGDNPQTVKTRLRRWAQVVACSVRQSSS